MYILFFCKNISRSRLWFVKRFLLLLVTSPPEEKILSTEADDAGVARILQAVKARSGNSFFLLPKLKRIDFFIIFTNSGFYVPIQLLLLQRYCG